MDFRSQMEFGFVKQTASETEWEFASETKLPNR
jgi:hypothetical protein